ncbi:branched-chain amino acid ABC transporter permease [Micromonospora zamorensis]|uniref:branched-chain amino acid ABC transporter permease n=1 Tax=Micromonospora TaxID=1873 RepID=UPI000C17BB35|nr:MULTISPECIES: branched-chain amino acid ABC transporter permease [unclassified Micromonospora]MBQ0977138.1 branched-chain amino acid ABC transporter permease [Micromonospora sp. M61]TQJ21757.1 amino acid/amide ABC transporter membrane protein 1 (HAAT family) [Micromonospora sp. A202]WSK47860.1 branched-chain amino acid ABC transporter permease [Micromonospora zamorensis]WTE89432.1 branched-chain amino acid ABC transporter permease [Micromonospora zamorensis]
MSGFAQNTFNGLVSGAFYALLALGLAVIFGMLRVVNFAHGAFYMLGAFGAYVLLTEAGVPFWAALVIMPVGLGLLGMALERAVIQRLTRLDPLYNFLLTFGLTLILQDLVKLRYGVQSSPYETPSLLSGSVNFGLFDFPTYRVFILGFAVLLCVAVWWVLTRTRIGMVVRASTERPDLTRAFGIDVGRWVTPVFGFGIGLAGLAGVLAAPMRAVNPLMGADLIIVVFAVVVIGGLGSIFGSVAAGFGIGLVQAWGEAYLSAFPIVSQTIVFVVMAGVLLWRPAGLFGREEAPA